MTLDELMSISQDRERQMGHCIIRIYILFSNVTSSYFCAESNKIWMTFDKESKLVKHLILEISFLMNPV